MYEAHVGSKYNVAFSGISLMQRANDPNIVGELPSKVFQISVRDGHDGISYLGVD